MRIYGDFLRFSAASHVLPNAASAPSGAISVETVEQMPLFSPEERFETHRIIVPVLDAPVEVRHTRNGVDTVLTLEKGDFIAIPAGTRTAFRWSRAVAAVRIEIGADTLRDFAASALGIVAEPGAMSRCFKIRDPELVALALRMGDAADDDDVGASILFESFSKAFLVTLVRTYADRRATGVDAREGLTAEQFRKILDYGRRNLSKRITTECLSKAAGMSVSAFTRALKFTHKQTPQQFLMALRLERAEELLADPRMPLGKIAFECGFSDQAHFTRSFRKMRGMTPSAWRRRRTAGSGAKQ